MTPTVKSGTRALGIAESYTDDGVEAESVLCGAVVRADRVIDGAAYGTCTVGGTDVTDVIRGLFSNLGREDVRLVFVAGVAPAWFNLVDLRRLADAVDRPVLSVSFESSSGLRSALKAAFSGEELDTRLAVYESLPPRRRVTVGDDTVFVRSVGISDDEAARAVRAYTPTGGRPEPLRVARLLARSGREWRDREAP
ncbi:hypothetical protein C499_14715 [Halogeometricum borinquense DSM 11551]|uniref:UPF0215 protein Hbor_27520 n=1 Tax=Halogeometricum borinquense (strain ATCC 700274 / DSM 11551 / JCM 10706 / KCTC 4070 / PR3) TaxID=469382 RepID=E4NL47_HALBP|nr:DUF99 family protein [Halogeometricum borinquense]ADQ68296.1 uncharacterized conserved protein [Halogeometricum borinquense DSM 11551]ELY24662.1 hypothetical protein C499_14715 [Halogeometricum borinquense DSM 11551]